MKRALLFLGFMLVLASPADVGADEATTVLLLTADRWPSELTGALRVELSGRGIVLGVARGDASDAHAAVDSGEADATLWIADHRLYLLGESSRSTPLPSNIRDLDPRVFGLIASSLVAESLAPPQLSARLDVDVDVDVDVNVKTEPETEPETESETEPEMTFEPDTADATAGAVSHQVVVPKPYSPRQWFARVGGHASYLSFGAGLGGGIYLDHRTELGVEAVGVWVLPAEAPAAYGAVSLRYVPRRTEPGPIVGGHVGGFVINDKNGPLVGAQVGYRLRSTERSSIDGVLSFDVARADSEFVPVALLSIEMELFL